MRLQDYGWMIKHQHGKRTRILPMQAGFGPEPAKGTPMPILYELLSHGYNFARIRESAQMLKIEIRGHDEMKGIFNGLNSIPYASNTHLDKNRLYHHAGRDRVVWFNILCNVDRLRKSKGLEKCQFEDEWVDRFADFISEHFKVTMSNPPRLR